MCVRFYICDYEYANQFQEANASCRICLEKRCASRGQIYAKCGEIALYFSLLCHALHLMRRNIVLVLHGKPSYLCF